MCGKCANPLLRRPHSKLDDCVAAKWKKACRPSSALTEEELQSQGYQKRRKKKRPRTASEGEGTSFVAREARRRKSSGIADRDDSGKDGSGGGKIGGKGAKGGQQKAGDEGDGDEGDVANGGDDEVSESSEEASDDEDAVDAWPAPCEREVCKRRNHCLPCVRCGGTRPIVRRVCIQPCAECREREKAKAAKAAAENDKKSDNGKDDVDDSSDGIGDDAELRELGTLVSQYGWAIRRAQSELQVRRREIMALERHLGTYQSALRGTLREMHTRHGRRQKKLMAQEQKRQKQEELQRHLREHEQQRQQQQEGEEQGEEQREGEEPE